MIPPNVLAQGALFLAAQARHDLQEQSQGPWSSLAFRRFGDVATQTHDFDEGKVDVVANADGTFQVSTGDFSSTATCTITSPTEIVTQFTSGRNISTIIPQANKLHVFTASQHYILNRPLTAVTDSGGTTASADKLVSPMPATVIEVKVAQGDNVKAGQVCAVLESMKMEINVRAGRDGVVGKVNVVKGGSVEEGSVLVSLEPLAE